MKAPLEKDQGAEGGGRRRGLPQGAPGSAPEALKTFYMSERAGYVSGRGNVPDMIQEPCPHGHEVRVPCSSCSGGHPSLCSCLLAFGSGHHHRSRSLCAIKGSQKEAKKTNPTQKCSVCLSRALAAGLHLETSRAALPPAIGIPGKATTKKKKNTRHLNYILI